MRDEISESLAIIGGGNMGVAIVEGLIKSGWQAQKILVCNHREERNLVLQKKYGVTVSENNTDALNWGKHIVLAIKPFVLKDILNEIGKQVSNDHIITSVAAGVDLKTIQSLMPSEPMVVRAMPNTPCSVNKGVIGLYAVNVTEKVKQYLDLLWSKLGYVTGVRPEDDLDVITAIFGSGPAYVFFVMEQLHKVAESLGLDNEQSQKMIIELIEGAGQLARLDQRSCQDLRESVTSPNGTTQAAINEMKRQGIELCFYNGIKKALDRARSIKAKVNSNGER